jgi:hypothetical protein
MVRVFLILFVIFTCDVAYSQTTCGPNGCFLNGSMPSKNLGFNLNPGEILVSVDGKPVSNTANARPIVSAASKIVAAPINVVTSVAAKIVNRNSLAYNHALREAQILADRGTVGHPLGVAPGCRFSGTGTSTSPDRPNHCYSELGDHRLEARAVVRGRNGMYYWSAHYR